MTFLIRGAEVNLATFLPRDLPGKSILGFALGPGSEGVTPMFSKHLAVLGIILGLSAISATSAVANVLTGASATADCTGYSLTVNATDLTPGTQYEIDYAFNLTCSGSTVTIPGSSGFER
jgi:hypothetical protein